MQVYNILYRKVFVSLQAEKKNLHSKMQEIHPGVQL